MRGSTEFDAHGNTMSSRVGDRGPGGSDMSERASQHQMISTSNMLTPVEVAERSFGVARKGLSPNEVRSFLRRVADSLGAAQEREQELVAQVERLEVRLDEPVELDERQLLDALGTETSRVLAVRAGRCRCDACEGRGTGGSHRARSTGGGAASSRDHGTPRRGTAKERRGCRGGDPRDVRTRRARDIRTRGDRSR